jgi:hypothetical protein
MATIKFEVDDVELWSSVFGSSPFSFGDHFTECDYLNGADWDKPGRVKISGIDENEQEVTKTIGIRDLAKALPIANKQVYMDLFNFDNYDSICADAVLQVALFGKVIYG